MAVMPLGPACVAEAVKRAGHETALLDLMFETDMRAALAQAIASTKPECIGISVRNVDDQTMQSPRFLLGNVKEVVKICRSLSSAPLVLGGAGYTIFPEEALVYLGADMGVEGEGEVLFPALLSALEKGDDIMGMPGIHIAGERPQCSKAFVKNLDLLPLPDPELLLSAAAHNPEPWIPAQTRRGCPMRCSYCSTANIEGAAIRRHSPQTVVAWLEKWVSAGYGNFYFVDNTFNLPVSYAKTLCRLICEKGMDITWCAIVYPGRLDAELVTLMAQAGCKQVSLGFESGSEKILRNMNKRFSLEDVRAASRLFAKQEVARMGFLLLGGPGETQETVEESLSFADSLQLDALRLTAGIRIYPNTPLAVIAEEQGLIESRRNLLSPAFYIVPELAAWLPERLKEWAASRPNAML